ncbi:MAG: hypothetical protein D8B47_07955 [Kingella sp. (in: b-proteobacteria)]|nr:MAG: hypothetical protein D8B47_07955 [Kingella sp. (in: b-proteobacteria)]
MSKTFRLVGTAALLAACASAPPPPTEPAAAPLPYPEPARDEQLEQLAIQISRLEQQVEELQTRVRQLERRPTAPKSVPHPRTKIRPAAVSGSLKTEPSAQTKLEQAQEQYRQREYRAAAQTLREADGGGDGSETARQSMFLLLQSHQWLGNCQSVINIGQRFATRFSGSLKAADALDSVAQCQWQIQQRDIARDTWRNIIRRYPASPAAERAKTHLNQ